MCVETHIFGINHYVPGVSGYLEAPVSQTLTYEASKKVCMCVCGGGGIIGFIIE